MPDPRFPGSSGAQTLVAGTTAGVVAIALLTPWLMSIESQSARFLLSLQLAVSVLGIVLGLANGARPVQIVTFTFMLAYLGVAPVYQLAKKRAAWGDFSSIAIAQRASFAA